MHPCPNKMYSSLKGGGGSNSRRASVLFG